MCSCVRVCVRVLVNGWVGGWVAGVYNPVSEQLDSCPEKRSNAISDAAEMISTSSAPSTTMSLRAAPHTQSFTGPSERV